MKNKQWLAAILIISLLAIAFFWGGDHQNSSTRLEESSTETQTVNNTATRKPNESTSEAGTKDTTKVLPNKPTEVVKSIAETKKKQEEAAIKIQDGAPTQKVQDDAATKSEKNKLEKPASAPKAKKDKYLTDPVPEGKPKPIEWQNAAINKNKELTCTFSVTCKTILDNMTEFNKDKLEVLPEDGIIYKTQTVTYNEGESVFDVLLREMKKNKIHMEFEMTPIYNSNYIEGIHNLYEFDCGELSGWMYKVNGWFPNYGCSRYMLKDGDVVEWIYTCDLGRDIGGGMAVGGEK